MLIGVPKDVNGGLAGSVKALAGPGRDPHPLPGYQGPMSTTTRDEKNEKPAPTPRRLKTWLGRLAVGVGVLVVIACTGAAVLQLRSPSMRPVDPARRFAASAERVARGRYIVEAEAHCLHCHSERDWKTHGAPVLPGLTGAGWDVPWADNHMPGPVFAPNLTPDPQTGLGAIPDDAVARAIREGVSQDGRALFMMPWQNYRALSDEDVASVVVYLRTLPAVKKARGTTAIRPPVSWFLKSAPAALTAPVMTPVASEPVARGKQLAEIGQCRTCHTPVDERHQPLPGKDFAGGQPFTIDGVRYLSSNITPDPSGISYYSEELFIRTMRTGNVGGRRLAPIMPWADIGKLTDADLKALWAYLKTVTPVAHDVERTPVDLRDNPAIDDRLAAATQGGTP
jgi:mono/diheme cytochrome c family protein